MRRPEPLPGRGDGPGGGRTEASAKRFLAGLGFPVTREHLAATAAAAATLAMGIGFPVVLKVQAAGLEHKTEAGAVRLGLRSAAEVRVAFAEVVASVKAHRPDLALDGVLVQEDGEWTIQGDPTEAAFLVAEAKIAGLTEEREARFERVGEIPF
ncbi:MAG: acetate--CoA ligase family protein, partial [Thermoanaerobaculia bacterium]